jgi:hypothetical protein
MLEAIRFEWEPNSSHDIRLQERLSPGEFLAIAFEGPQGFLIMSTTSIIEPALVTTSFYVPPEAPLGLYRLVQYHIQNTLGSVVRKDQPSNFSHVSLEIVSAS